MIDDPSALELLLYELREREESGFEVSGLVAQFALSRESEAVRNFASLWAALTAMPRRADWPYREPGVEEAVSGLPRSTGAQCLPEDLTARIRGGWTGRVIGNMLGKAVEVGWTRSRLDEYLRESESLDSDGLLRDWVVASGSLAREFQLDPSWTTTTRGRVDGSTRDDDIDFTILNLGLLEDHGADFTVEDVAAAWLRRLPFGQVFTAERITYANLTRGLPPSLAGRVGNPYREWIGALIRADIFGYVNPGRPERAARLAAIDAALSHSSNGVYGAMWVAALCAIVAQSDDVVEALRASTGFIPPRSRLAETLRFMISARDSGLEWGEALDAADERLGLDRLHHVHVLNNAAVIAAALLWGRGEMSRSIGYAVQGGLDTDSNGATVGSIVGLALAGSGIDSHWTDPVGEKISTALFGESETTIGLMAERSVAVARRFAATP